MACLGASSGLSMELFAALVDVNSFLVCEAW